MDSNSILLSLFGAIALIVIARRFFQTWGWVKNLVFFFGAATLFSSCDNFESVDWHKKFEEPKIPQKMIDGCDYIVTSNGTAGSQILTHKGNCTNPIHIYNTKK